MACVRPARTMFRTICQGHPVFAILNRTEFSYALGAYNSRPVDTKKLGRVQLFFERIHGFADQMRPSAAVEFCIIPSRCDPFNLIYPDNLNSRAEPNRKARDVWI